MVQVTHNKVATTPDDPSFEVGQTEWNDTHAFTMATGRVLGRLSAGVGPVEELPAASGWTILGVMPAANEPAHTGDVTNSAGSLVLTIGNAVVTYAKMQNVSAASLLLGRGSAAGAGSPQEITLGTNLSMSGTTLNATGGGGGTPGGSTLQLQYNNAGAFGGMAGTSWDNTNRSLTMTGATVTVSHPVFDLTQTWNAAGVVFTGLRFNVTNTASSIGSKLLDLQAGVAGGQSIFAISANPGVTADNGITNSNTWTFTGGMMVGSGATFFNSSNASTQFFVNASVGWTNGAANTGTPDTTLYRDAANTLAQRNGTNAQTFRVYNTFTDASNYERGVFDWTTNPNTLSIGVQYAGTGSNHVIQFNALQFNFFDQNGNQFNIQNQTTWLRWGGTNNGRLVIGETVDTAISKSAPGVLQINNGAFGTLTGTYIQWGGQARVTADFSVTSSAVLVNVTGMTVNVAAGRTYHWEVDIPYTCAAAGGIQAAMAGTATWTNIIYDGYIIDSGANGIKGNTQATAIGAAVASAVTTGTTGHLKISGTGTCNAAGTLTTQIAQNTSNGTATIAKRGAVMIVHDMP